MMVETPDYIENLIHKVIPWIEFDVENSDFHLRYDAPKEIKDAQKKIDQYATAKSNPFGFVE